MHLAELVLSQIKAQVENDLMAQETKVTGDMMHKTCTTFRSLRVTVTRLINQKHVQSM